MKFFVTGGAGFIGSHFCDQALRLGHQVAAYDDLSTGLEYFLKGAVQNKNFELIKGDIRNLEQTQIAMKIFEPTWVIHFAANADVRKGLDRPRRDLDYNTIGTWNVLEAMRSSNCKRILFSSTGSTYGEPTVFPTPETCPFPEQTSLYGASKAAGEGLISAYCNGYGLKGFVFRFVSILGPRYTHGHVFDFMQKLKKDSSQLEVLGNGKQLKSYLNVEDLMAGLWKVISSENDPRVKPFNVFNIGHDEALTVDQSISYIVAKLGLKPKINYSGGERGWVGDSPRIQLDTQKLKSWGWAPKFSLKESVEQTVAFLVENGDLLNRDN